MDLVKVCALVGTRTARRDLLAEAMRFALADARGPMASWGLSSVKDAPEFRAAGCTSRAPTPVVLAARSVAGAIRVDFFDSDLDNLW